MFHKTPMRGFDQVWYRHGELPWWKWFAFHLAFRRLGLSVFVAILLAGALFGLTVWFGREALDAGRLNFAFVLVGCIGVPLLFLVLPTVVAKKIRARIAEDSDYRFGDMLGGDDLRKGLAAPSFVVLREYERTTQLLEHQPAENREIINQWLAATWDADYQAMEARSMYDRSHRARDRWGAVTDRILSFMDLPLASAPGVGRVLDELARSLYQEAYREEQQNLAATERALEIMVSHRDMLKAALSDFSEAAPDGFEPPPVSKPHGSEVATVGRQLFLFYREERE